MVKKSKKTSQEVDFMVCSRFIYWGAHFTRVLNDRLLNECVEGGTIMTCPATLQRLYCCPMAPMEVISWETVMRDLAALPCLSGQSAFNTTLINTKNTLNQSCSNRSGWKLRIEPTFMSSDICYILLNLNICKKKTWLDWILLSFTICSQCSVQTDDITLHS